MGKCYDKSRFKITGNTKCGGGIFEHKFRLLSLNLCAKISPPQKLFLLISNLVGGGGQSLGVEMKAELFLKFNVLTIFMDVTTTFDR